MITNVQTTPNAKRKKNAIPLVNTVRQGLRRAAEASGLSQQEIGEKMGLANNARKAVSRLLNPGIEYDPRLSTLLRFADAVGKTLKEII